MQTEEQKENFGRAQKTEAVLHHHHIHIQIHVHVHRKCILWEDLEHVVIKEASYITFPRTESKDIAI